MKIKLFKSFFLIALGVVLLLSCSTSSGSLYKDTVAVEKKELKDSASEETGDTEEIGESEAEESTEEETEEKLVGLEINSMPDDAEVYLDNRYMGVTPLILSDLEQGKYKLTIKIDGYYDYEDWISFYDDYQYYEAELEQITGYLLVNTIPVHVKISVGSTTISSGQVVELPIGRYSLQIKSFGYEYYSTAVEIYEKEQTLVQAELKKAMFNVSDLTVNRKAFNPKNAGLLGSINVSFQVTSYGTATGVILNEQEEEVYKQMLDPFQTWEQSFKWNGRDSTGTALPDGIYRLYIEAVPGKDVPNSGMIIKEIPVSIDSSIRLTYRSIWSGSSGLMYSSSPDILSSGSFQIASLMIGHFHDDPDDPESSGLTLPWNLSLRLGLGHNLELNAHAGIKIDYDSSAGETIVPFFTGVSLKAHFIETTGKIRFGSSGLIKLAYQNVHTDTLSNFTGLSAGLASGLSTGPLSIFLSPEIILSPQTVTYDPDVSSVKGIFFWVYGRTGLLLDFGTIIIGSSVSFRTLPFNQGFSIDFPMQGAVEAHVMIPGTQIFLSLAFAAEFSVFNNFYFLGGGGLGLLN